VLNIESPPFVPFNGAIAVAPPAPTVIAYGVPGVTENPVPVLNPPAPPPPPLKVFTPPEPPAPPPATTR
jgi:hypothetical protein